MRKRPAKVIVCECGEAVHCSGFTSTCAGCGRDYNWNGSLLAPRSAWGEESGETVEEILAIDSMTADELLNGE